MEESYSGPDLKNLTTSSESEGFETLPFEDLLYALREEGLRVSTNEWLDFTKCVQGGLGEDVDMLYALGTATLVKRAEDLNKYDEVFARLFFSDVSEKIDDAKGKEERKRNGDYEEEDHNGQEYEQKDEEDVEDVAEATSLTSEDSHGGNEATKDIEDSPNSANDGENKDNKGAKKGLDGMEGGGDKGKEGEKGGKHTSKGTDSGENGNGRGNGGEVSSGSGSGLRRMKHLERNPLPSARDTIEKKIPEIAKDDELITPEKFAAALARLKKIITSHTTRSQKNLDPKKTSIAVAKSGGRPDFVYEQKEQDKPRIMILCDWGGSMDSSIRLLKNLFQGANECFNDLDIKYFHNGIYGEVFNRLDDRVWVREPFDFAKVLNKDPDTKVIVISDCWMGHSDTYNGGLHDSLKTMDEDSETRRHTAYNRFETNSALDNYKELIRTYKDCILINPILKKHHYMMDASGTIKDISRVFEGRVFEFTIDGLEKGIVKLME